MKKPFKKEINEIRDETKARLRNLGKMGDTYDSVIISLIEHAENCDQFWSDRF